MFFLTINSFSFSNSSKINAPGNGKKNGKLKKMKIKKNLKIGFVSYNMTIIKEGWADSPGEVFR